MTEQVTALIKFKTCDLARDLATATSAYDSAEATAWVVPFTHAQQAYWAEQAYWNEGVWMEPFNGYAADYATQRTNAITNTANSAYENCMAGGASSLPAPALEPSFRLVVHTQLDGGNLSDGGASVSAGPSTQLSVAFSPTPTQDRVLDWKAFYRLGQTFISYRYATEWILGFPAGGGFLPEANGYVPLQWAYATFPMERVLIVDPQPGVIAIAAEFVPYIDVPEGYSITPPLDLTADFSAVHSFISFVIRRRVVLPDGQQIEHEVSYESGYFSGSLPGTPIEVNFPAVYVGSREVSGVVDVYHFMTAYSFGTVYKPSDKIQQVRVHGVDYDYTIPTGTGGSSPPAYGPPGLNSIHRSFYYSKLWLNIQIFNPPSMTLVVMPAPMKFSLRGSFDVSLYYPLGGGSGNLMLSIMATDGFELEQSYAIKTVGGYTTVFFPLDPIPPNLSQASPMRPSVPFANYNYSSSESTYTGGDATVTLSYRADVSFESNPLQNGTVQEEISFDYINMQGRVSAVRIMFYDVDDHYLYSRIYPVWTGNAVPISTDLNVSLTYYGSAEGDSFQFFLRQEAVPGVIADVNATRYISVPVIEAVTATDRNGNGSPSNPYGYRLDSGSPYFYEETSFSNGKSRCKIMVRNTINGYGLTIADPMQVI